MDATNRTERHRSKKLKSWRNKGIKIILRHTYKITHALIWPNQVCHFGLSLRLQQKDLEKAWWWTLVTRISAFTQTTSTRSRTIITALPRMYRVKRRRDYNLKTVDLVCGFFLFDSLFFLTKTETWSHSRILEGFRFFLLRFGTLNILKPGLN